MDIINNYINLFCTEWNNVFVCPSSGVHTSPELNADLNDSPGERAMEEYLKQSIAVSLVKFHKLINILSIMASKYKQMSTFNFSSKVCWKIPPLNMFLSLLHQKLKNS